MTRTKQAPAPQIVDVFSLRLTDDTTKSDVTVRGWVVVHHDGTTIPAWDVHHGPGLGPHDFCDLKLGRKLGWAMQQCMDALHAFTGIPDDEQDPQMTLADAPLTDGHGPTIRVGAR